MEKRTERYGFKGHEARTKHRASALLAQKLLPLGCLVTALSHSILSARGYTLFEQPRVGLCGDLFMMPKLQTMSGKQIEHHTGPKNNFDKTLTFIRDIAGDEFVQLSLVSLDPETPGPMVMVSHRAQMPEELDDMEFALSRAGKATAFNRWFTDVYCTKRPGVLSNESLLDKIATPGTIEYFEKRMQLGFWYQEHASPSVDYGIACSMLGVGATYALVTFDPTRASSPF